MRMNKLNKIETLLYGEEKVTYAMEKQLNLIKTIQKEPTIICPDCGEYSLALKCEAWQEKAFYCPKCETLRIQGGEVNSTTGVFVTKTTNIYKG